MDSILEEVAVAADEVTADQREVARRARVMQRQRARGWSWGKTLDSQAAPGVVSLLRRSRRRLAAAAAALTAALVSGLRAEGDSHGRIAARLGVTRQRVTTLLGRHQPDKPLP